jgi:uncharacterized protein (UPF0303 family)
MMAAEAAMTEPAPIPVFEGFSSRDALQMGLYIIEQARNRIKRPVAVHIELDSHPLFTHFMDGTSAENLYWVTVKKNVVRKFGISSWAVHLDYRARGEDFATGSGLSPAEYRAEGGSIPLTVAGQGRVGTVTVSGLDGSEDHALALEGMMEIHRAR